MPIPGHGGLIPRFPIAARQREPFFRRSVGNNKRLTNLLTGLAGYWKFNSDDGIDTADINGINGFDITGVTAVAGKLGNGYQMGSSALLAENSINATFNFASGVFTVAYWLKIVSAPGSNTFVLFKSSGNTGIYNQINNTRNWNFSVGTGSAIVTCSPTAVLPNNDWALIVNVVDKTTLQQAITYGYSTTALLEKKTAALTAYSAATGVKFGFNTGIVAGTIVVDELACWSRALTDADVLDLWNGGAGLSWPF